MIHTLTPNPCIDLNLQIEEFIFNEPLRASGERRRAGGKGINVSRVLAILGAPSVAIVPLGGPSGQEFMDLIGPDQPILPIAVSGPTRTNTVITESAGEKRHLKVNQTGGVLSEQDAERIRSVVDERLEPGDVLVLAGSLPPGLDAGFYGDLIASAKGRGAVCMLDADREPLRLGIEAGPVIVKPNRDELARWAGHDLNCEGRIVEAARRVLDHGCRICLVSDGARPAWLVASNVCLKGYPAAALGSPVGAGDACLAGLIKGLVDEKLLNALAFDREALSRVFRLALACGSAAASMPDTEYLTLERLEEMLQKTRVEVCTV